MTAEGERPYRTWMCLICGFVYDEASTETIDAVIDESSGETLAGGAATVHILYTRIQ